MDSFELNKIAGAVLATLTLVVGMRVLATELFEAERPEKPGYEILVPEAPTAADAGGAGEQAKPEPLPVRLAAADVGRGEAAVKKCVACHSFEKGGAAKVGPNLWDVVERQIGSIPGFAYSQKLQEYNSKGEKWTYDHLDAFLLSPKASMPGTIMGFAGIKKASERADVILYLREQAEQKKALPTEQTGAAPDPAKAAEAK